MAPKKDRSPNNSAFISYFALLSAKMSSEPTTTRARELVNGGWGGGGVMLMGHLGARASIVA